jgi:hypothetical protein
MLECIGARKHYDAVKSLVEAALTRRDRQRAEAFRPEFMETGQKYAALANQLRDTIETAAGSNQQLRHEMMMQWAIPCVQQ